MNTPDFHILKEKQEKKLKSAIIIIAVNPFENQFKCRVIEDLVESIKQIHTQREIVYKDTEGVDQDFKLDLGEEPTVNEEGDTEKAKLEVIAMINEILESEKKVRMEVITNQSNFEKIKDREKYREASDDLSQSLSFVLQECMGEDSRSFMNPDEDEKYQLTEDDLKRYPELKEEGLKVGDFIEMPLEALITDIKAHEEELAKKKADEEAAAKAEEEKNSKKNTAHSPDEKDETKTGKKDSKNEKK